MKGNTTSATIHGVDGRKQVRRQRYRRGRWMDVTLGNRRQEFIVSIIPPCLPRGLVGGGDLIRVMYESPGETESGSAGKQPDEG